MVQTQVLREVMASGSQTDGRLSLTVVSSSDGFAGPPLHLHTRNDEAFCVLEGEVTFRAGDVERTIGPGGFVFVPAQTPHAFRPVSAVYRMIEMFVPGDFDGYFEELEVLRAGGALTPARVAALQEKYGMVVVGPPLEAA